MEVITQAQDAVVTVHGKLWGTGFIFDVSGDTAFVITANHVIEDEGAIGVRSMGETYLGTRLGYNSDQNVDVAVLAICCRDDFRSLPWSTGEMPPNGEPVVLLSRPIRTVVSTIGSVQNDDVGEVLTLIGHDAPAQEGSSGAPVLTLDGKVLGVHIAMSNRDDGQGYAVPYGIISTQIEDWKFRLVQPAPNKSVRRFTNEECDLFGELMNLAATQGRTADEMYDLFSGAGINRQTADDLADECLGHLVN